MNFRRTALALVLGCFPLVAFGQRPTITSQPQDQTVGFGVPVTLSVTAGGAPPLRYQWRLNGENIPGQTGSTLSFANAQPTNGGTYSVVVFNLLGAVKSANATLLVGAASLGLSDSLAGRSRIFNVAAFTGIGSNVGATTEPGEPDHAGKEGGHSVWLGWIAPANGFVTFHTHGSSFDTLLAAYTGSGIANLSPVIGNDDLGPGFTSQITFNVTNGQEYFIAVDGRAGATGNIVLSWNFVPGSMDFPQIFGQPDDIVLSQPANPATFYIGQALDSQFQWFHNDTLLPGETAIGTVQYATNVANLGVFNVRVTRSNNVVFSEPAVLEIATHGASATKDKFEDVLEGAGLSIALPLNTKNNGGPNLVSFAAGAEGYQIFNNHGSTSDADEPIHAGVSGGASRWQGIIPENDGILLLDTTGSDPDTVLSVYTGESLTSLNLLAEDDNSGPDGKSAQVRISVIKGRRYLVAVDTVNAATGVIHLNWHLGDYPLVSQPSVRVFDPGDNVTLTVSVVGGAGITGYQWSKDGQVLSGQTSTSLSLYNLQTADEGYYTLTVNTIVGPITSTVRLVQNRPTPTLVVEPRSTVIAQGLPLDLPSTAVASLPIRYQWQYQNKPIKGATNVNYSFPQTLVKNSGAYRVVAMTDAGSVTSAVAYVTILIPPSIITPPKPVVISNSRKATFKVKAAGSAPLSYQWRFNDTDIPNANGPTYTILNVQSAAQLGEYYVVVNNALGLPTGASVELRGVGIKTQPHDVTVALGKKFSFKVKGIGPAPLHYQWRQNGNPIPDATNATYAVASAPADAGGTYTVDVSSPLATITSSNAVLTVTSAAAARTSLQPAHLFVESSSDGTVQIILRGATGTIYELQVSEDLLHWKSIGELTPGTDAKVSFRDASSGAQRFYRAITK